ncbi:MAG: hypothetical protein MHM6MM_003416 [Cercozoa sp. M6MM]
MPINIVVNTGSQRVPLSVNPDTTVSSLKVLLAMMAGASTQQQLFLNGRALNDSDTMQSIGVTEGSQFEMRGLPNVASLQDRLRGLLARGPAALVQECRSDPQLLAQIAAADPQLGMAVSSGQVAVEAYLAARQADVRMQQANADLPPALAHRMRTTPNDPETQRLYMEYLRHANIQSNLEQALHHLPETFAQVVMLYVPVKVNGVNLVAFVDSGAQITTLSKEMAEKTNLMRLVDSRYRTRLQGVGTSETLGRVHAADVVIGGQHLMSSFTITDGMNVDMLLGLDLLRRHQIIIDLKHNCLVVNDVQVPFLSEAQVPRERERRRLEQEQQQQREQEQQQQQNTADGASHTSASMSNPSSNPNAQDPNVQRLIALGVPREQAPALLQAANGNVELAVSLFFQ